jgi:hypothetical protein
VGIKIAGALIEMDDLSGAAYQLSTLKDRGDGKVALSRALLWLHIGNADEARRVISRSESSAKVGEKVVLALADMADGEFEAALDKWRAINEDEEKGDEMVGMNMAVCLLYMGKMSEVCLLCSYYSLLWHMLTEVTVGKDLARGSSTTRILFAHTSAKSVDHL